MAALEKDRRRLAIVGGGVIGVAIALLASRRGFEVHLFEPNGIARGASYGNAAMFAVSQCTPLASPRMIRDLVKMVVDRERPLRIRPDSLFSLMPWGFDFLRHCNARMVQQSAGSLAKLLHDALPAWRRLAAGTKARGRIIERGALYVYARQSNLLSAEADAQIRRAHGAHITSLTDREIHDIEPSLQGTFAGGLFHEDVAHVTDPQAFVAELAEEVFERGGFLIPERVTQIRAADHGEVVVSSASGDHAFHHAVIAAGIDSVALAGRCGAQSRIAAERGYHLELHGLDGLLSRPVGIGDAKFVASPLEGRLRLAGTAEFARPAAPPDWRRAHLLLRQARRFLPDLPADASAVWMGARPSTPDSLPVICPAPAAQNVFLAYGHGHLGLTLGAITAEIVCDDIEHRRP